MTISRPLGSSDMRPSVKPENMAENKTNTTISTHCSHAGIADEPPSQVQAAVSVMLVAADAGAVSLITSAEQNRRCEHCWLSR
mmetsp:Transcript_21707/g.35532  ORF Transcript_21707/g.35532 Transcript_21707/m.35532 type:complete len:83 (-) Transcript_21707:134-382(-)